MKCLHTLVNEENALFEISCCYNATTTTITTTYYRSELYNKPINSAADKYKIQGSGRKMQ